MKHDADRLPASFERRKSFDRLHFQLSRSGDFERQRRGHVAGSRFTLANMADDDGAAAGNEDDIADFDPDQDRLSNYPDRATCLEPGPLCAARAAAPRFECVPVSR